MVASLQMGADLWVSLYPRGQLWGETPKAAAEALRLPNHTAPIIAKSSLRETKFLGLFCLMFVSDVVLVQQASAT